MDEKTVIGTRAQIAKRIAEAAKLRAEADSQITKNIEASIEADTRAAAVEKAVERLHVLLSAQIKELLADSARRFDAERDATRARVAANVERLRVAYPSARAAALAAIKTALGTHPWLAREIFITTAPLDPDIMANDVLAENDRTLTSTSAAREATERRRIAMLDEIPGEAEA
jgi:hypothetical protein